MKTKRTISLALLALMLLTLLPQAAWAAPGTCPNCGANDWKQTADGSNCTFPGQIEWTCKKCGYYTYTDATKTNPNVHD